MDDRLGLWLTVKQFAARFNLPLSSTYDMISDGTIQAVRIGGRIRIDPKIADTFAQATPVEVSA